MRYRLFSMALLCVISTGSAVGAGLYYNSDPTLENPMSQWMRWLPDSVGINALSIPGTHNTMALHGGDLVENQSLSVQDQLRAGIRSLDIRARHIDDAFAIHHGAVYQEANFGEVLAACQEFLSEFPSETILLRLSKNGVPEEKNVNRLFNETYMAYRDAYAPLIWQPDATEFEDLTPVPTLGDVRGKIVLLQDFFAHDGRTFYGINFKEWVNDDLEQTAPSGVVLQDVYDVATIFNIDDFWEDDIMPFFDTIDKESASNPQLLYHQALNGVSSGAFPYSVAGGLLGARGTNDYALEHLFAAKQMHTGITAMDFPGAGLINAIIAHNIPLVDFSNTNDARAMVNDFQSVIVPSLVPSVHDDSGTDGQEALDRALQINTFLKHVLPDEFWHVVVAKDPVAVSYACTRYCPASVQFNGYRHYIHSTEAGSTDVSKAQIENFLAQNVGELSGSTQQQANDLLDRAKRWVSTRDVSVLVKQGPFGYDNWAFLYSGAGAMRESGSMRYAVMVHSGPINDVPRIYTAIPDTRRTKTDWSGTEGEPITIGIIASDRYGEPLEYRWDFNGDGLWDTDWSNDNFVTHIWEDDFDGTLKVQAFDGEYYTETTAKVTIADVLPIINAPDVVESVAQFDETFQFSDPGGIADGPYRCVIRYGSRLREESIDDCLPETPIRLRYDFLTDTTHTVKIEVIDSKGAVARAAFDVKLSGIYFSDSTGCLKRDRWLATRGKALPCELVMLTSSVPLEAVLIDYGDGSRRPGGYLVRGKQFHIIPAHSYSENGLYTVTISVMDAGGLRGEVSFDVDVRDAEINVPPALIPPPERLTLHQGQPLNATFNIDDPDDARWRVYIRYAKNLDVESFYTSERQFSLSHTYTEPGTYTLAFSVEDDRPANSTPRREWMLYSIEITVVANNE